MTESNRTKLTGMYVNESKNGDQYLSGKTMDGTKNIHCLKMVIKKKITNLIGFYM